jgi:hypothetical protein
LIVRHFAPVGVTSRSLAIPRLSSSAASTTSLSSLTFAAFAFAAFGAAFFVAIDFFLSRLGRSEYDSSRTDRDEDLIAHRAERTESVGRELELEPRALPLGRRAVGDELGHYFPFVIERYGIDFSTM